MHHQFFLNLFIPFPKGPLKYFNIIYPLKKCYLSLTGFCGWYWQKACLFRWNAIKTEKAKFSKQYPYLVPRSYANSCRKPPAFSSIHLKTAANVKCQVSAQYSGRWSICIKQTRKYGRLWQPIFLPFGYGRHLAMSSIWNDNNSCRKPPAFTSIHEMSSVR